MGEATRTKIALLTPMPSELAPLKRRLDLQGEGDDPRIWVGRSGEVAVIATTTGMGTANAARATKRLLDAQQVDHVMVVGIAGGVGSTEVGAVIRPALVVDHASGAEYRPTHPDGRDGEGTLCTSDEFIVVPERVAELVAAGVIAVDMETAAIAAVCHERKVPWSVVRVISDLSSDHPDDAVLGMTNPDGTPNITAGLRFMLRNPKRVPQLMRLARDATAAARTAAKVAADTSAQLSAP